jgi:HSP20 family protein
VNVRKDDDKYEIEVAAPGMKKADFKLKLENDVLTISSEKKEENKDEKNGYSRREFCYQSFQRSFTLPEGHIMTDKIQAVYNDGILKIELPKREEIKPQPPKEIAIK